MCGRESQGLIGDVQAGKSSLASVLASAELDDGHGRARLELFRHGENWVTRYSRRVISIRVFDLEITEFGSMCPQI